MAFGDYATLQDDFNRANASPLDGSWTNKIVTTNSNMTLTGNQASASTGVSSAWFTGSTPGADCEAYWTVNTKPSNGSIVRIYLRLQSPGTAGVDGYFLQYAPVAGTDTWDVFRLDNASATSIANGSRELTAGEKIGLSCIGDQIAGWVFASGSWTQLGVATDATYASAGPAGIGGSSTTLRADDFFMGTVSTAKPKPLPMLGVG